MFLNISITVYIKLSKISHMLKPHIYTLTIYIYHNINRKMACSHHHIAIIIDFAVHLIHNASLFIKMPYRQRSFFFLLTFTLILSFRYLTLTSRICLIFFCPSACLPQAKHRIGVDLFQFFYFTVLSTLFTFQTNGLFHFLQCQIGKCYLYLTFQFLLHAICDNLDVHGFHLVYGYSQLLRLLYHGFLNQIHLLRRNLSDLKAQHVAFGEGASVAFNLDLSTVNVAFQHQLAVAKDKEMESLCSLVALAFPSDGGCHLAEVNAWLCVVLHPERYSCGHLTPAASLIIVPRLNAF